MSTSHTPKTWRNVDRSPDSEAERLAEAGFRRVDGFDAEAAGATLAAGAVPYFRFNRDAQREFDDWRSTLEFRLRSGSLPVAFESHLAKFRGLVPALALLLHLADDGRGPVPALHRAIGWAKYLEGHARRLYGAVITPQRDAARTLLAKIRAGDVADRFSIRDVYRHEWAGLRVREEVEPAVRLLTELGWLQEIAEGQTKPKGCYLINPAVFDTGGEATLAKADESRKDQVT